MNLLIHASPNNITDELKVNKDGFISFSKNEIVSGFGQWIYILNFEKVNKNFKLFSYKNKKNDLNRKIYKITANSKEYVFYSNNLKSEYRCYENIPLNKDILIGKIKHFDLSKGLIEKQIVKEIINNENKL